LLVIFAGFCPSGERTATDASGDDKSARAAQRAICDRHLDAAFTFVNAREFCIKNGSFCKPLTPTEIEETALLLYLPHG
jgi:hypothetical protein